MNAKTVIVTGGSQGIGAGLVQAFLNLEYNVVANSRHITTRTDFRCEGHRGCDHVSDGIQSGDRGGAARGQRCARWQMVTREGTRPAGAEQQLKELGITLPSPPEPFGTYVEAVQTGHLLFLSGMLPTEGHGAKFIGRVGAELDVEAERQAAHLAALNALAVARQHLGSLDQGGADRPPRRVGGCFGRRSRSAERR